MLLVFYAIYWDEGVYVFIFEYKFSFSFICLYITSLSREWKVSIRTSAFLFKILSIFPHSYFNDYSYRFVAILKAWKTCAIFLVLLPWKHPTTQSLSWKVVLMGLDCSIIFAANLDSVIFKSPYFINMSIRSTKESLSI